MEIAAKPPLLVTGMWGLGDSIHQRAVVRELMKTREVWLETFYYSLYEDLIAEGLHLLRRKGDGRIEEKAAWAPCIGHPREAGRKKVTYDRSKTVGQGSLLAGMFLSVGLTIPEWPDFSLPVKESWRAAARKLIEGWDTGGRPLMVYRPVVQNTVWRCPARSPDPFAYDALYRSIRERFFVVSIADLRKRTEWIEGPQANVDVELHKGELTFEGLVGLFAEADMVFGNAGFTPILAQAVGTPNIVVYGGNEGWPETNSCGAHHAPTLPIEPDKPCRCHMRFHDCDKRITLGPALERLRDFVDRHVAADGEIRPKVLIFATTYVDTPERLRLTHHWLDLHRALNSGCDFTIVDSASPLGPLWPPRHADISFFSFPENIGHLSRNGGRDGWGRAFCKGLELAIAGGYDYAVHIEGDSLFRLPVMPIVRQMQAKKQDVVSVPVLGTTKHLPTWVETGLMFFRVPFVAESGFIAHYDWPSRKESPTPEIVIKAFLGDRLTLMPWKAQRGDKNQITVENVTELDWVTHCHTAPEVYDRFVDHVLGRSSAPNRPVKVNFGCGQNRLEGWNNHDADVDIAKRLPFEDNTVDFILVEHCVEHVDYYAALGFFKECARILKPWGMLRVIVPSIERIIAHGDAEYFKFVRRWAPSEDLRGALHAILYAHGHKAAWTESLLAASLTYAGFKHLTACEPGRSRHSELRGVDGHHKAIGERNNWIESAIVEAEVDK